MAYAGELPVTCEEALTAMAPRRFPALAEVYGASASEPAAIGLQIEPESYVE